MRERGGGAIREDQSDRLNERPGYSHAGLKTSAVALRRSSGAAAAAADPFNTRAAAAAAGAP